jgi:hypothetical protein
MKTIIIATVLAALATAAGAESRSIYHPDDLATAREDWRESRHGAAEQAAEDARQQAAAAKAEARRPKVCEPWFDGRAKCEPSSSY